MTQIDPAIAAAILAHDWTLEKILAVICAESESTGCVFMTTDPAGMMLTVAGAFPTPKPRTDRLALPVGYGVMGLVAANGRPVVLNDDSPRDPVHRDLLGLGETGTVARLCLPVFGVSGDIVGVLGLHRSVAQPFSHADADFLTSGVALLGLRWDSERLRGDADRAHIQQDALVRQAISAQEAERRRIAGDLHDGVTQVLVSMNYHLSAASAFLPEGTPAAAEIGAARDLALRAYDETRAAISGLHSLILDDLGLVAALESLAQTTNMGGLAVDFALAPGSDVDDLPDHVSSALYRIAQEALHNAVKHASAARAQISLRRAGGRTALVITDDGIGFDAQIVRSRSLSSGDAEHFGLSSIAERCALLGAKLRIDSASGRGTSVIVELIA